MKLRLLLAIAASFSLAACSTSNTSEEVNADDSAKSSSANAQFANIEALRDSVEEAGLDCSTGTNVELDNMYAAYQCGNGDILGLVYNVGYGNMAVNALPDHPEKVLRGKDWLVVTDDPEKLQEKLGGEIYVQTPFDRAFRACGSAEGIELASDKTEMTLTTTKDTTERAACILGELGAPKNVVDTLGQPTTNEQSASWEEFTLNWTTAGDGSVTGKVVRSL